MILGPENPTPAYIEERIGRDVRVVRHEGEDLCGLLVAYDGYLHIDGWWTGHGPSRFTIPGPSVKALYVRG